MSLPVLFSLNNPMLSPILIMVACFLLGGMVSYIILRIGSNRRIGRSIREYAKAETARLHAQLDACLETGDTLKAQNIALKQKIAAMSLYLGKAVTEARIDE